MQRQLTASSVQSRTKVNTSKAPPPNQNAAVKDELSIWSTLLGSDEITVSLVKSREKQANDTLNQI